VEDQFNTFIEKGFSALVFSPDGDEGQPIETFDAGAIKILMFPILSGG
jgi:hypothetical protein